MNTLCIARIRPASGRDVLELAGRDTGLRRRSSKGFIVGGCARELTREEALVLVGSNRLWLPVEDVTPRSGSLQGD